jgi:GNAT superfamily N-acetyltransferase
VSPTNEVEIRPARDADLRALPAELGDREFFADRLTRQAEGLGVLLTAWAAGLPIGTVYVWMERADEPEVREYLPGVPLLNHVEVLGTYRNRLVGTKLVTEAERILAELGYAQVALAVNIDNTNAERLYKRLGYQRWEHDTVICSAEVRQPDGTRKVCPETCYMLIKPLSGSSP